MPIFELDEGRPRLVQPMQPLPGSFGQDCAALLTHHLAAVAGEPLFVVRPRTATHEHADVPELLALDSTGRPVIVEVVQVVDDDAVVATLRHAGAAARMTTTDLARAYHPDPSRFPVDFAAFREQVAFGATTSRREGVRLVVLCSEVAAEAGDTLAFLRGPGRHVDVLQVGVVRGVDDRRMIDVSPLAAHETVRRSVEPTALRLVRSSEAFATAMAYDSGRLNVSRPPMPGAVAGAPPRVSSPDAITPVSGLRVSADARPPAAEPGPARGHELPLPANDQPAARYDAPPTNGPDAPPNGHAGPLTVGRTVPSDGHPGGLTGTAPATTAPHGDAGTAPAAYVPVTVSAPHAPQLPAVSGGPRPLTPPAGTGPAVSLAGGGFTGALPPTPARPETVVPPAAPTPARPEAFVPPTVPAAPRPAAATAPRAEPVAAPSALDAPLTAPAPAAPAPGAPAPAVPAMDDGRPLPELTTLAKRRRAITTLVWHRERRNQRLVAMLRQDGLIQLPDGRAYADPDLAAAAAAGSVARIDGWRSWRMGDGGPTLAEAAGVTTP
jgi:hypothetical protein